MDVSAYFPNAFIEILFAPFSCTDNVSVCGLEGMVYAAKKVILYFSVRCWPCSD